MPKNHATRTEQQSLSAQSQEWQLHCHVGLPQTSTVKGADGTVALKWQLQSACQGP